MEIVQTGNNSDCPPFSKCWCEKHPNGYDHPNCKPELEIGGFVFNSIFFSMLFSLFNIHEAKKVK